MLQRVAALTGKTFRFGIGIVPGHAGRGVLKKGVQAMTFSTIVMTGLVLVGRSSLAGAESMPTIPGKKNVTVEQ